MMERRALMISTGLSLLAMYLVYQYVSTKDSELQGLYGPHYKKMVIARRDILQYETIRPSDIEEVTIPNSIVPPGLVDSAKAAKNPPGLIANSQDVIDAVAAVPIMK